ILKEAVNLPCPFPGQKRADRVNQPPAGPHELGANVEQPLLKFDHPVEPLGREAPAPFRVAPPGSAAGAGRVHEDEVRAPAPVGKLLELARRVEEPGLDGCAGPRGTRSKLGQAGAVAVGRENDRLWRRGRERERLATRPGTKVEDALAILRRASERDKLAAF